MSYENSIMHKWTNENISFFLLPLSPDVYIHTWDETGVTTKKPTKKTRSQEVNRKTLEKLYSTNHIIIEKFNESYTDNLDGISVPKILKDNEPVHYKGSLPMYYKIYMCNDMKRKYEIENNFKYDRVIRLRPDLSIKEYLPGHVLEDEEHLLHSDYLINQDFQVSDKFAIGTSNIIDYYSSVFIKLNDYWSSPLGVPACNKNHRVGERLMKHHMDISSIRTRAFHLNCQLCRDENSGKPGIINRLIRIFR